MVLFVSCYMKLVMIASSLDIKIELIQLVLKYQSIDDIFRIKPLKIFDNASYKSVFSTPTELRRRPTSEPDPNRKSSGSVGLGMDTMVRRGSD